MYAAIQEPEGVQLKVGSFRENNKGLYCMPMLAGALPTPEGPGDRILTYWRKKLFGGF
jgi:hypothetical protein